MFLFGLAHLENRWNLHNQFHLPIYTDRGQFYLGLAAEHTQNAAHTVQKLATKQSDHLLLHQLIQLVLYKGLIYFGL